eukprot:1182240-Prorocentrum_minimum.AAC.5
MLLGERHVWPPLAIRGVLRHALLLRHTRKTSRLGTNWYRLLRDCDAVQAGTPKETVPELCMRYDVGHKGASELSATQINCPCPRSVVTLLTTPNHSIC